MEARNWNRHIVEKDVICTVAGVKMQGFLYDLSAGGCMVEMPLHAKVLGKVIGIDIHGPKVSTGVVVWQSGPYCGVRFDVLMDEAVVRQIGFTPPELSFDDLPPRDRLGQILPANAYVEFRPGAF